MVLNYQPSGTNETKAYVYSSRLTTPLGMVTTDENVRGHRYTSSSDTRISNVIGDRASQTPHHAAFTCFVDVFLHRAGRATVLGTAESFWLKDGSGEFADTGFMIKLSTDTNRTTFHILTRHFTWKTWVLSSLTLLTGEVALRDCSQSQALHVKVSAALPLTSNKAVASLLTDLTHSVLLTRADTSPWQTRVHRLRVRSICVSSSWRAIYLFAKAYLPVTQSSRIGVRCVSVRATSRLYIRWGATPFL